MHEDSFFELAGELPVKVEFIVDDEHAERLLSVLRDRNMRIFFMRTRVEAGTV